MRHPITSTVVLCTGGFDPVHSGHIKYFKNAAELGDQLVIGLNSDAWLQRKKGRNFMPWVERASIIRELKSVVTVIEFDDTDGTAIDAILRVRNMWPHSKIIFANGGDRTSINIPEMSLKDDRLEFVFGVGGDNKSNSSSWILKNYLEHKKTDKPWGFYTVLEEVNSNVKVKKLHVLPGKSLSLQKHQLRNELWFVAEGEACLETQYPDNKKDVKIYNKFDKINIPTNSWHRLFNISNSPVELIEIQYGDKCVEEDIERQ